MEDLSNIFTAMRSIQNALDTVGRPGGQGHFIRSLFSVDELVDMKKHLGIYTAERGLVRENVWPGVTQPEVEFKNATQVVGKTPYVAPHLSDSYEPTMDIRSMPGTVVRFRGAGGYDYEQKAALDAGFVKNGLYTVQRCDVGSSVTQVLIDDMPGRWNSCLFADISKRLDEAHGSHLANTLLKARNRLEEYVCKYGGKGSFQFLYDLEAAAKWISLASKATEPKNEHGWNHGVDQMGDFWSKFLTKDVIDSMEPGPLQWAPIGGVGLDTKRLDFITENRVAVTPEFEGDWEAEVYNDLEKPQVSAHGATPRIAIDAAMNASAGMPDLLSTSEPGKDPL